MDKLWGFSAGDDPVGANFNKFLGYTVLGHFIFCLWLTSGVNIQKVIGYSSIPSLISLIVQTFVTKVESYDMQKGASVACDRPRWDHLSRLSHFKLAFFSVSSSCLPEDVVQIGGTRKLTRSLKKST
jgi:hypothetical protein